jgi:hypothetical protein
VIAVSTARPSALGFSVFLGDIPHTQNTTATLFRRIAQEFDNFTDDELREMIRFNLEAVGRLLAEVDRLRNVLELRAIGKTSAQQLLGFGQSGQSPEPPTTT